jgi:hypothetical protein
MMRRKTMSAPRICLLTVSLLGGISACGNREPRAPVVARAPEAPPVPAGGPADLRRRSILDRLTLEAQSRPAAAPKVEVVEQALAAAGVPLQRWKQVLASPIGARFCMTGQTATGTVVAVCEFGSAAEASAGISYSHKTFDALIPNRSLIQRGPTVVTITRPASPSDSDEVDHVAQIFARL